MLSVEEIHFLVDQGLNNGSFLYRDHEPEEIDEAINTVLFKLVNEALDKEEDKRDEVEKLLLRGLTTSSLIVNTIPDNFYKQLIATSIVYRPTCKIRVSIIEKDKLYQSIIPTLYNGVWYKINDIFIGQDVSTYYGQVVQIVSKQKKSIFIEPDQFDSFTPIDSVIFTIVGKSLRTKSKFPIYSTTLDYIRVLGQNDKMDSTIGQTLPFNEVIQRWVIDRTIIKLSIRDEEPQQKVANLVSEQKI